MRNLSLWKAVSLACIFCAAAAIGSPAQDVQTPGTVTFKTLVSFDRLDGGSPYAGLVQGTDGNFYGTTLSGGANQCGPQWCGTVFKISPAGELTSLHNFCAEVYCTDGAKPYAGLILATNGNFYGTTDGGGAYEDGAIFEITPSGKLTTLHSFCEEGDCADGAGPLAGLVQATHGDFYGTTVIGGANTNSAACPDGCGTAFKVTPAGMLTTLYSFCGQTGCRDGELPVAALLQATNGNFYGTTEGGGVNHRTDCEPTGCGTVFEITAGGKLTTLHSFDITDGYFPQAALVQATDGNFYGAASSGGAYREGTIFKITPGGKLTTLYSFCSKTNCADGAGPDGLVQATDGNFYGTTGGGGAGEGYGTVFEITAAGKLTTLHRFDRTDGAGPSGVLVQATNGTFYGTTSWAGAHEYWGTVYSLSVGLGPFVETNPTSGKVGAAVIILGNNLTGSSRVTFNGKAATFKVVSSSEIRTTVPKGATTGKVSVKTPSRTLTSNVNFRVP
jgi:uncharacterized repeat protein (TIGR03803 family)